MGKLDHRVVKDLKEPQDPLASLDQLVDLASVDFLDLPDRQEIPELMVSQARPEKMANEALLVIPVQVDPLASEELQVLKDHAALLAEKAQKDQKAPLVSVVTLALTELVCSHQTANLHWLSKIYLTGLYLKCSKTTQCGEWFTIWETSEYLKQSSLAAAISKRISE